MNSHNGTKTVTLTTFVPVVTFVPVEASVKLELRAWKLHEVPIGALIKCQGNDKIQRIIGVDPKHSNIKEPAILLSGGNHRWNDHYFLGDLVTCIYDHTYSLDGINWERCGVWEVAE